MEKLIIHEERCKNCGYCVAHCPRHALSVAEERVNAKGYAPVDLDEDACIRCGVCYAVCPDYVFEIREGD